MHARRQPAIAIQLRRALRSCSPTARHAARGQVAIIFAMVLLVLIGAIALSVDGGFAMAERRQAQNAADAGALAAAKALYDVRAGSTAGKNANYTEAGRQYALQTAGNGATVTVSAPFTSNTYRPGQTGEYIRVTVQKPVTKYFLGAIYGGDWSVTSQAVAGIERVPADYALVTLERDDEPGIYLNGNTGIVLTGGNASAMSNTNIRGNNNSDFTAPGTIDANRTISRGTRWSATRENQPQIDDPLAYMTAPAKPSPTYTSAPCTSNCSWNSGTYRNFSVTLSRTVTFNPGVYYFENVDIALQNTNSRVQGTNVLLYFDSNSSFDPKNGEVSFTARTTAVAGVRQGVVIWYAPCNIVDYQGNGELFFEGIVYAPCAHWSMHGNPNGDTIRGQMFLGTLEVKGTSDLHVNYRQLVATERPKVFLVE